MNWRLTLAAYHLLYTFIPAKRIFYWSGYRMHEKFIMNCSISELLCVIAVQPRGALTACELPLEQRNKTGDFLKH